MTRTFTVLLVTLLLLLALEFVDWHVRILTLLYWPAELIHPNGVCVYHARNVMRECALYSDWQAPPYVAALYGPLFYWIPGVFGRWADVDTIGLFFVGRWISLLSTWGTALLTFLALWRRERTGVLLATIAATMFTTGTMNYPTGAAFRPDSPVTFLTLAGLLLAVRFGRTNLRLVSLAPFILAFLYKQSALTGPIAVILYLLLDRESRAGISYALAAAVLFGATVLAANVVTQGHYWVNCFQGLQAQHRWWNVPSLLKTVMLWNSPAFLVAGIGLLTQAIKRRFSLYAIAFGTSVLLATLAALRRGSNVNYFVEGMALACLLMGIEFHRWRCGLLHSRIGGLSAQSPGYQGGALVRGRCTPSVGWWALAGLGAVVVNYGVRVVETARVSDATLADFSNRRALAEQGREAVLDTVRWIERLAESKPVLCQDSSLSIHLTGEPVVMDSFLLSGLSDLSVFRDVQLVADNIRAGRYGAIVLNRPDDDSRAQSSYQNTTFFPRKWIAALRETKPAPYRLIGSPIRLTQLGAKLRRTQPRPYRFYGSPTPFLDVYVPTERFDALSR